MKISIKISLAQLHSIIVNFRTEHSRLKFLSSSQLDPESLYLEELYRTNLVKLLQELVKWKSEPRKKSRSYRIDRQRAFLIARIRSQDPLFCALQNLLALKTPQLHG